MTTRKRRSPEADALIERIVTHCISSLAVMCIVAVFVLSALGISR